MSSIEHKALEADKRFEAALQLAFVDRWRSMEKDWPGYVWQAYVHKVIADLDLHHHYELLRCKSVCSKCGGEA